MNEFSKKDRLELFNINIAGYWREVNKVGIPAHSGVFFVYENRFNEVPGTVTLIRVLYIGEADNVRERIATHPMKPQWLELVTPGNELCYSTCHVPPAVRTRIKAAFIYKVKPCIYTEFNDEFRDPPTTIIASGMTHLLQNNFTVGS